MTVVQPHPLLGILAWRATYHGVDGHGLAIRFCASRGEALVHIFLVSLDRVSMELALKLLKEAIGLETLRH